MAALILVKPGVDWQSSAGLFEFALEYLIPRLSDRATAEWMRTVVDNNLGSVWFTEFSEETQEQIFGLLRNGLVEAGDRELPDGPAKPSALARLRELADLTYRESPGD